CTSNEPKPIEYRLNYDAVNQKGNESIETLQEYFNILCETCTIFANFLMKTSEIQQNDPFLFGIDRIINEEDFICQKETSSDFNRELIGQLKQLKMNYEHQVKTIELNENSTTLSHIYQLINRMNTVPMITIQLDAIKNYHEILLKNNEHDVPINKI
ncbi:unnamed protein product, partial [Rotaria sp. Silwood2]